MSDIILDILRRYVDGIKIKKASARSGGEYHSPCPKCGGTDRFCVFPEQPGGALAMQHGITGTWACPCLLYTSDAVPGTAKKAATPSIC